MSESFHRPRPDWMGGLIGLLTFFVGIGLLLFTFQLAHTLFSIPPENVVATAENKTVDLARAGDNLAIVLIKVVMLLVMSVVGSVIANRGIRLYNASRTPHPPEPKEQPPEGRV